MPKAEAHFERALRIARKQNAKSWELRAVIHMASLWLSLGERRRGLDLLGPVYSVFTESFETPDLQTAKRLLTDLNA